MIKKIIYLGFNNPIKYKRGVENVILFQKEALNVSVEKYYIFFDDQNCEFNYEGLKCIGIKHNALRFVKMNKKISKLGGGVIHSHNPLMSFFLLRQTDILTVHDALFYLSKSQNRNILLLSLFYIIEKIVYKRSKKIHFISEFAKKKSLYENGSENLIIMNTTPFEKLLNLKTNVNSNLKMNKNKFKLFTVRSLEKRVRPDLLIKLSEEMEDFVDLEVAGKGPLLKECCDLVKKKDLKSIKFLGYISDEKVVRKYKECDAVIVLAESGEGFGLPIIEGYLFDKPVIASNVCAIPEVIEDSNCLFNNNLKSISEKVMFLIENSKKENKKENYFNSYYMKNFLLRLFLNNIENCTIII